MKKAFLALFIVVDLGLIGGSTFVLYAYVTHSAALPPIPGLSKMMPAVASTPRPLPTPPPAASAPPKAIGAIAPAPVNDSSMRKIGFTYHNAKAKQVSIRADFTGWKAQPMTKGANGLWTYAAPLTPGEYAYCFTADDKTFKDPANKRTKLIGRTTVSAIVVEARPSKTSK